MPKCPYCNRNMGPPKRWPRLNRREQIIMDTVVMAGTKGALMHQLIDAVYGDEPRPKSARNLIANAIHHANKKLAFVNRMIRAKPGIGIFRFMGKQGRPFIHPFEELETIRRHSDAQQSRRISSTT